MVMRKGAGGVRQNVDMELPSASPSAKLETKGGCPACGGEVPAVFRGRPRKFCSEKCRAGFYTAKFLNKEKARVRRARAGRSCRWCGGDLSVDFQVNRRYCSRECNWRAGLDRSSRARGTGKHGPVKDCLRCGKPYKAWAGHLLYCSEGCGNRARLRRHRIKKQSDWSLMGMAGRALKRSNAGFIKVGVYRPHVYTKRGYWEAFNRSWNRLRNGRFRWCEVCGNPFWSASKLHRFTCGPECTRKRDKARWRRADGGRVARLRHKIRRRARKRGVRSDPEGVAWLVKCWSEMVNPVCGYCGEVAPNGRGESEGCWQVDHLVPLCLGGPDEPGNLVLACVACNLSKGGKVYEDWVK